MKTYKFPYYISFGKNDNLSLEFSYELSDEKAGRLEYSAKEGGRFRLSEDDDIQDIFDEVYFAILKEQILDLKENSDPVIEFLRSENRYKDGQKTTVRHINRYLDSLDIGVNYPEELQYLKPTEKKKHKQSVCKRIVLSREEADVFLKAPENNGFIVLIDGGETLYHVPPKYEGRFTITSDIKAINYNAFRAHKKITEIVIENGLTQLEDRQFESCEQLERVTIPGSIKSLPSDVFSQCRHLSNVKLSEGIEEIESTAFRFCYDLKELHIPASIKTINPIITVYYNSLHDFYFEGLETKIEEKNADCFRRVCIYARVNSKALSYAIKHKIEYQILEPC